MVGAVPGLLMKSGAEGVCAFALADGRSAAVKFDDGAQRPVAPLMATLLRDLIASSAPPAPAAGLDGGQAPDRDAGLAILSGLATTPVTGGGVPVGEIRAALPPLSDLPPLAPV